MGIFFKRPLFRSRTDLGVWLQSLCGWVSFDICSVDAYNVSASANLHITNGGQKAHELSAPSVAISLWLRLRLGNAGNFLSRFTGAHLGFEVIQEKKKVEQLCFCLVCANMQVLTCCLGDTTEIPPPIVRHLSHDPLSHFVFLECTEDYRCYTPTSFHIKMVYRNPETGLGGGVSQEKLASETYRGIGSITWNSIANCPIVGPWGRGENGILFAKWWVTPAIFFIFVGFRGKSKAPCFCG